MEVKKMRDLGVLALALMAVLAGCATNPHKAEKIATKMENVEAVQDESLGVKDGNLVVQHKVKMNEELRKLQFEVYELEDRIFGNRNYGSQGLYGSLKECRKKQTSKDLGGDGKLIWTEPADRVTAKEEVFNVGIDETNRIVGVSEEFLSDRIARFKKYKTTLNKRMDEYEEKLEICDAAVKAKESDMKAATSKPAVEN
jgi:hypothetical protein